MVVVVVGLLVIAIVVVHNCNVNNDVAVHVTKKFSKSSPIHSEH